MHIAILLDMSMDHTISFTIFCFGAITENGFAQYIRFGRMTNHDMLFEMIMIVGFLYSYFFQIIQLNSSLFF